MNLPECAVCGHPVDEIIRRDDHSTGLGVVRFTARCHGMEETTTLTFVELHTMTSSGLSFGKAFATKQLEGG